MRSTDSNASKQERRQPPCCSLVTSSCKFEDVLSCACCSRPPHVKGPDCYQFGITVSGTWREPILGQLPSAVSFGHTGHGCRRPGRCVCWWSGVHGNSVTKVTAQLCMQPPDVQGFHCQSRGHAFLAAALLVIIYQKAFPHPTGSYPEDLISASLSTINRPARYQEHLCCMHFCSC